MVVVCVCEEGEGRGKGVRGGERYRHRLRLRTLHPIADPSFPPPTILDDISLQRPAQRTPAMHACQALSLREQRSAYRRWAPLVVDPHYQRGRKVHYQAGGRSMGVTGPRGRQISHNNSPDALKTLSLLSSFSPGTARNTTTV